MSKKGFVARSRKIMEVCPYCHGKLSWLASYMRKTKKIFKCRNCGKIIDERFIFW